MIYSRSSHFSSEAADVYHCDLYMYWNCHCSRSCPRIYPETKSLQVKICFSYLKFKQFVFTIHREKKCNLNNWTINNQTILVCKDDLIVHLNISETNFIKTVCNWPCNRITSSVSLKHGSNCHFCSQIPSKERATCINSKWIPLFFILLFWVLITQ